MCQAADFDNLVVADPLLFVFGCVIDVGLVGFTTAQLRRFFKFDSLVGPSLHHWLDHRDLVSLTLSWCFVRLIEQIDILPSRHVRRQLFLREIFEL